jgi:serine protease
MNALRSASRWLPLVALALTTMWAPSQAEYAPKPAAPLPAQAESGRVIVKFKSDAATLGKRIMAVKSAAAGTQSAAEVAQILQARATNLGNRLGLSLQAVHAIDERTQVVTSEGIGSRALAARLAADGEVEYAVEDGRRRAQRVPNDPLYLQGPAVVGASGGPVSGQWYLRPPQASTLTTGDEITSSINAQGAWDITTGHPSVVVAVLDTGIRPDHPDLAGKVLPGYDMVSDATVANDGNGRDADPSDPGDWINASDKATSTFSTCDISDSSWHGTMTAGLIGASTNNGVGMAGVGWGVKIVPVRVLGKCFGYDSDIIAGMRWGAGLSVPGVPANAHPAKVLNLSLGGDGACSAAYSQAVNEINAAGVVIVASAGNSSGHAVGTPANCPGVIGVGGLRHIGTKVGFSDIGPELTISAPAGNCVNTNAGEPCLYPILTTANTGTTTPGSARYTDGFDISVGTSFSAPLVSGTAALMMTAHRGLTPAQVIAALKSTARAFPQTGAPADASSGPIQQCQAPTTTDQLQCYCTTTTCGAGMLDAAAAVAAVAKLEAYVDVSPVSPQPSQVVQLGSASTVLAPGTTVASYAWSLVDGGGIVSALSATSGASVTATPSGNGSFTVRLTVTDSAGGTSTVDQAVQVGTGVAPAPSSGGGGGALSALWLLGLACAAWALRRTPARG